MSVTIEMREEPGRPYVGVRRVVKQDAIGEACAEILPGTARWLAEHGLEPAGPPMTVYHAVDRESGDYDIQPAFFVAEPVVGDGRVTAGETAGGEVLRATHVGPYETIGETWHALFAHAEAIGRSVTRSSWEVYVDDPGEVDSAELRTEISVPVDPA